MGSISTLLLSNQPCFPSLSLQGAQCYAAYKNYYEEICLHYFNGHCFQNQRIGCYYFRLLAAYSLALGRFLYLEQFFVCLKRHLHCYFCRRVKFPLLSLPFLSILLLQHHLDSELNVFIQKC
jgi:hypothetical protein